MNSDSERTKKLNEIMKLPKGTKVKTCGNTMKNGTIHGKYKDLFVVQLDKPVKYSRNGDILELLLVHPDNIMPG